MEIHNGWAAGISYFQRAGLAACSLNDSASTPFPELNHHVHSYNLTSTMPAVLRNMSLSDILNFPPTPIRVGIPLGAQAMDRLAGIPCPPLAIFQISIALASGKDNSSFTFFTIGGLPGHWKSSFSPGSHDPPHGVETCVGLFSIGPSSRPFRAGFHFQRSPVHH